MKAGVAGGPEPVEFLGLDFDPLTPDAVHRWLAARGAGSPFAYVVTPNVDHMVRLLNDPAVPRHAYDEADLCLCDSRILSRLGRWCGIDLPVVPGSDLTAAVMDRIARPGDRICLIGGSTADAEALVRRHPALTIVHHDAAMGLLTDSAARAAAIAAAAAAGARVTLLAVGAPQQELIAWEMARAGTVSGTALCIGASVDFLIGKQARAPGPVQRLGMEWAWRLGTQPRRLWRRYLVEGPAIFPAVWRWRRGKNRQLEAVHAARTIRTFADGSCDDRDWDIFTSCSLRDAEVDQIRRRAEAVELPVDLEGKRQLLALADDADRLAQARARYAP